MRIIGGKYKGKKFLPPKGFKSRPTTDFAKEGLFNVIQHSFNIENIDVLDLFSGTGSISYEFCSRGCNSLIAVESVRSYSAHIEKIFTSLNFEQARIVNKDVFKYLSSCNQVFDVIFADPPFDFDETIRVYEEVFANKLLSDTSYLIIEHSDELDLSNLNHFVMKKKYGKVIFSFFDPCYTND